MDRQKIEKLLGQYETALNQSDANAVVPLYTADGVFMPTEAPTAQGSVQLLASYKHIFNLIQLNIKFEIQELVVSGDMAYAVTMSRGQVTIHGPKITQPEENRELFVFRKESGDWKMARYMFNKSKPSK